ncbi:hypothetical protein [Haladaptatus halobius]|uniref:hypothetical protein n=1 Tax=Haladaptatus halobius TaxID=2884875 RepID=UPI001D09C78F|nr:hypothetical protein [Haladaptatus halobius]
MESKIDTMTGDGTSSEQQATETTTSDSYDLPVSLFAGIVILIMGILVIITPLFAAMPTNSAWDPVLMNLISGSLYVIVGAYFIWRGKSAKQ